MYRGIAVGVRHGGTDYALLPASSCTESSAYLGSEWKSQKQDRKSHNRSLAGLFFHSGFAIVEVWLAMIGVSCVGCPTPGNTL
jgi:hypothetical protein